MTDLDPQIDEALHQLAGERAPAHVRLDPVHQDDVLVQARSGGRALAFLAVHRGDGIRPVAGGRGRVGCGARARHRQSRGRPDEPLDPALRYLDDRPRHLEVVEVLGFDGGDGLRLPGDTQMADYAARGLPGVVPAFEGGDRDG